MNYLTGKGMIDDALTVAPSAGAALRSRMLAWLNITAQKLATVRPWQFLNGSATVQSVDGVVALPADFGEVTSLQGESFYLDKRDALTDGEAFIYDRQAANSAASSYPVGYTVDGNTLTFHGAVFTGALTLRYVKEPQTIADSATATVWPVKCRPLFHRALLSAYYEFDFDERYSTSLQLDANELYDLKKWDNKQKPIPKNSRHGYRRTR